MNSDVLQNPADPDATYRIKAGKKHHGYLCQPHRDCRCKGSVVTGIISTIPTTGVTAPSQRIDEKAEPSEETQALIADGHTAAKR